MTHGIFSRPGVVDALDRYGRPMEIHDGAQVYWGADGFVDTMPSSPPVARASLPACVGGCDQGDRACQHPDLCVEDPLGVFVGLRNAVLLTLGAVGVGALLAWVFS